MHKVIKRPSKVEGAAGHEAKSMKLAFLDLKVSISKMAVLKCAQNFRQYWRVKTRKGKKLWCPSARSRIGKD